MLKVCVIGMGPIGNLHARIYQEDPLVELAGVCDIVPERAKAAAQRFHVPAYASAREMLAAIRPDLCSVTTGGYEYSSDHYEPTIQALEAGCHVLCEKPICNDVDRAREMVATAKRLGRCFGVDFNHRFTPAARTAERWLSEGRIGDPLFVNMALWIGKFQDFASPYFHIKALNPHSVDMMRHYNGDIVRVQCFAMKAPGRSIWSSASINMQFANGSVGHLTSSYDIERGHPMERCEMAGTRGRFIVEDMWREATLYPAGDPIKMVYTNPVFGGYQSFDDTFRERIRTFVRQVDAGVHPDALDGTGMDGLKAQLVIQSAITSLETGRIVDVPQE